MPLRGVDLVRLGLDGDRWGLPLPGAKARAARQRVADVIDRVGASSYAHRRIGECSGGEQQRLLIAQALIRRPELLLLDEPLDSLDVTNQAAVSALVKDICRREGVAVLLVAHDVNPLLPYLDHLVYVAHGSAVIGRPDEVVNAETLTRLYGTPVDVLRDRNGRLVVVGQPDAHPGEHRHEEPAGRRR
jgi:zinc/manganese transport system ATP-binding protein